MPLDTRIPLSIQQPQFESPLNAMLKMQQMRRQQSMDQMAQQELEQRRNALAYTREEAARKSAQDFAQNALPPIARLPPEQRDAALQQAIMMGARMGVNTDLLPRSWSEVGAFAEALAQPEPMSEYQNVEHERKLASDEGLNAHRRAMQEAAMLRAQNTGGGATPYGTFIPTASGIMYGNNRTGEVGLAPGGQGVVPIAGDPLQQENISKGKSRGKVVGEQQGVDLVKVPAAVEQAQQAISLVDQMVGSEQGDVKPHPGFSSYVGATATPGQRLVEGSPAADFEALYNQVTGQAFLDAYETLKGGGQITEIEGKKATAARTRMSKAQSEAEFVKAAREFQQVVRNGVIRAQARLLDAQETQDEAPAEPAAAPSGEVDWNSL